MNTINYYQVVEQTREEKIAMYKKLSKEELISMLLENQRLLSILSEPLGDSLKPMPTNIQIGHF